MRDFFDGDADGIEAIAKATLSGVAFVSFAAFAYAADSFSEERSMSFSKESTIWVIPC